jgi:hypothetical protein
MSTALATSIRLLTWHLFAPAVKCSIREHCGQINGGYGTTLHPSFYGGLISSSTSVQVYNTSLSNETISSCYISCDTNKRTPSDMRHWHMKNPALASACLVPMHLGLCAISTAHMFGLDNRETLIKATFSSCTGCRGVHRHGSAVLMVMMSAWS